MSEKKHPTEAGTPKDDEAVMSEREIDLNLIQTFPASDPPSWTLGTDHQDESEEKHSGEKRESEN